MKKTGDFLPRLVTIHVVTSVLIFSASMAVGAQDNHEELTTGNEFFVFRDASPDYSDTREEHVPTGKDLEFTTYCYDVNTLDLLDCFTSWRIYYGVPASLLSTTAEVHEWTRSHNHEAEGSTTRKIGTISATPDLGSCNDPDRTVCGQTVNHEQKVTLKMPKIAGTITLSGRFRNPPDRYHLVIPPYHPPENPWTADPEYPPGGTNPPPGPNAQGVKVVYGYTVVYKGGFTSNLGHGFNYVRCGELHCPGSVTQDTEDRFHNEPLSGTQNLDSFYGENSAIESIASLGNRYWSHSLEFNQFGDHLEEKQLRFAAVSLRWGGLYDRDNHWETPLVEHRNGKSVDIDKIVVVKNFTYDDNGNQTSATTDTAALTDTELDDLDDIACAEKLMRRNEENNIHTYHYVNGFCKKRNYAPRAIDQWRRLNSEMLGSIILTGTDRNGDELTFSIEDEPGHGRLSGNIPFLFYTPDAGFLGEDSFTFKVNDGKLDSNIATVSIEVLLPPTLTTKSTDEAPSAEYSINEVNIAEGHHE